MHVRKSTCGTEELHHLQKQQVLKDTHPGDSPITNPELDESDENEGEETGGYVQEDDRLTRVLALRAPVDTRWNSLYFMIKGNDLLCNMYYSLHSLSTICNCSFQ